MNPLRLAILASHPIQYQAPLFRQLAARAGLDLHVLFMSDHGVKASVDPGFGKAIAFDVPLLDGYRSTFLPNVARRKAVGTFAGQLNPGIVPALARGKYDVLLVHGYTQATTWASFAAARAVGTRLMLRGESTLLYEKPGAKLRAKRLLVGGLVRACDALLYIGRHNREFYETYGAGPSKLFFAPYSVDNAYFAARAAEAVAAGARDRLRASVGAGAEDVVALFVGKLIERKRPLDLVAALQQLPRRFVAPFVGDGAHPAVLDAAIANAGVRATVVGFANQSELPAWYAAADVQVLPSSAETWGLVVNEGMACGLPALVSDKVGCGGDLVAAGGGGVFRCADPADLARALADFASGTPSVPERRAAALARVAAYDVSRTADGIEQAARAVTGRS